jgi:hypothetical protein
VKNNYGKPQGPTMHLSPKKTKYIEKKKEKKKKEKKKRGRLSRINSGQFGPNPPEIHFAT